ncbi:hypothetical protein ACJIZ3_007481 [Penstemon smallii]|uniref:Uncharacterized protein n=1 Tax=Penstemon smallii TaxID=265156 RepID=A0ABD3SAY0_9LAMI
MENSAAISEAKMADSPEESSWTFYIEGFMYDKDKNDDDDDDDDQNTSYCSEYESPSLVSDAASSAVQRFKNISFKDQGIELSSWKSNRIICKQNSFKKQRNTKLMTAATDCDLEDTASSPVNSPKISYTINQFMNQKEKGKMDISEVKRNIFTKAGVFTAQKDTVYTDLKKRTCG